MHDDDPLAPGGPRRPALLLAAEHPPQLVRQAASSGSWERVRRGVYRETRTSRRSGPDDERDLVLDRATALHRTLRADHVLSHTTAALVHGLSLWTAPRDVHVVQPYRRSGRADPTVARHLGLVDAVDRCVVGGLPVTTPARTVADCLRTLSPLEGLVVADAALAHLEAQALLARVTAEPGEQADDGPVPATTLVRVTAVLDRTSRAVHNLFGASGFVDGDAARLARTIDLLGHASGTLPTGTTGGGEGQDA